MKRSEYLRMCELVLDLRGRMRGLSYGYSSAEEASYDEGKMWAYELAADDLEAILEDVVVDVEDVKQCDGFLAEIKKSAPHVLGSRPYSSFLDGHGCRTCAAYLEEAKV